MSKASRPVSWTDHFPLDDYRVAVESLAVESLHGCSATFLETVRVADTFRGKIDVEAHVHVFDLRGHATATVAYAWSQPVEGSTKRRILAVLHQPPVDNPLAAVRAGIAAQFKGRADGA